MCVPIDCIDAMHVTSVPVGNPNFMITFIPRGIEKYRLPIIYILVFESGSPMDSAQNTGDWILPFARRDGQENT